jgi:hypothetical protein
VAWYTGDNTATDSVGLYNGTWAGTAAYTNGINGQAFAFGGSSLIQSAASATGFPVTIVFWARPISVAGGTFGRYVAAAADDGQCASVATGQGNVAEIFASAEVTAQAGTVMPSAAWTHVAVVFASESSSTIYTNNAVATRSLGVTPFIQGNVPNGSMSFGGRWDAAFVTAWMDDVMLFNRALTATEIAHLYQYR